ncbi:MAG: O-antigen ligase family protein [Pseudomonadota bacterium]
MFPPDGGNSTGKGAVPKLSQSRVDGFWLLLGLSFLAIWPFPVGPDGAPVSLSLYDLFLPLVFLFAAARGWVSWPGRTTVLLFLTPVLLIVLHSVAMVAFASGVHLPSLAFGTLKTAAFFLDIGMLALLLQGAGRRPSLGLLLFLVFGASVQALGMQYLEVHITQWVTYETIYAATITGLLLLLFASAEMRQKPMNFLKTLVLSAWAFAVVFLLYAKIFTLVAFLLVALFLLLQFRRLEPGRRRWLAVGVGAFAALAAFFVFALIDIKLGLGRVSIYTMPWQEIQKSFDLRLELWTPAWRFAVESFPWGIGVNQFGPALQRAANAQALVIGGGNVHNVPLQLLTELGALGIGIGGALLALVGFAARRFDGYRRAMLGVYILLPMLLHGVLGLRVFHVVLAYGLARTLAAAAKRKTPDI